MKANLTEEDKNNLYSAFEAACSLLFAGIKDNHSPCVCFHMDPFNPDWDKKTLKQVKESVQLYVRSWIVPPMEKALELHRHDVEIEQLAERRKLLQRRRDSIKNLQAHKKQVRKRMSKK